ncbi:MAG: hypothetical protein ACO3RX_01610 [Chthoniobacterales bacterium]
MLPTDDYTTIQGWRIPNTIVMVYQYMIATFPNAGMDSACCIHLDWNEHKFMVDYDEGKIRIGIYEETPEELDDYAEEPCVWIEIPNNRQDLAIKTLEGLTDSF